MSGMMLDRALAALLRALAAGPAGRFHIVSAASTPWASATFEGARHAVTLALEGEDAAGRAAHLRRTLPEMEFSLRGNLVADIAAIPDDGANLGFEALILAEY